MKEKLFCLAIGFLFLQTTIPTMQANDIYIEQNGVDETISGGYFIFGYMSHHVDPNINLTFRVVSFIVIIGNGEITRLEQGEIFSIHNPQFGRMYNSFFIGLIEDYSIQ